MKHSTLHALLAPNKKPPAPPGTNPHDHNRRPKPPIHDVQVPPPPGFVAPGYPANPFKPGRFDSTDPRTRLGNSYGQILNLLAAIARGADYPS